MAAHGTRSARGEEVLADLRDLVRRARPGHRVELTYLEISSPRLSQVLPAIGGPVVIVPMLLTGGYHLHIDLPAVVAATEADAVVAGPLGPHPLLTDVLARRLEEAGLRADDAVLLGAAGSADPAAQAAVRTAARMLAVRLARPVTAAFASAGEPSIEDATARLRRGPAARVATASYLLAPGFFHDRLRGCGADVVGETLGADPGLAALVWERFEEARGQLGRAVSSRSSAMISSAASSDEGP
jgi:sirohydrochlorin ferrochelatase